MISCRKWDDTQHSLVGVRDAVLPELEDLEWDGFVGERLGGFATVSLLTDKVHTVWVE